MKISRGLATPFGVTQFAEGINFSLFSHDTNNVKLILYGKDTQEIDLEKTGSAWHIMIDSLDGYDKYAYKINDEEIVFDPYAQLLNTSHIWGHDKDYHPIGYLTIGQSFDWGDDAPPNIPLNDLIIYETHVRSFTQHPSSKVAHPGTFLGLIEKIPYLKELGVNAVELLPIFEFNENEYQKLCLYWGYSTVNFFSPMNRYGVNDSINEFKTLVKELHKNGIEVILDVVYNHTANPALCYEPIDKTTFYITDPEGKYLDYTGCGNTLNSNNPATTDFIIDSLRYWVSEMHVDGFRFDLASSFYRDHTGAPLAVPPVLVSISEDPILSKVKLIAEPWDAAGQYHVGNFYMTNRWSEWNGKYRDDVRKFIKGTLGAGEFATRLCGSQDLYNSRHPCSSINFVTVHDGFSMADLVSYNEKHNEANGEDNRDGTNDNESWNCGVEGPTDDPAINALRHRQMKNFFLTLMVSQGVPLIHMGDEYAHTKNGNNNTWCQDNDLNYFLWDKIEANKDLHTFVKNLIQFRKDHEVLRRDRFLTDDDIAWHGVKHQQPDWKNSHFIAYTLFGEKDLYIAFNSSENEVTVELPPDKTWQVAFNTNQDPKPIENNQLTLGARSSAILKQE